MNENIRKYTDVLVTRAFLYPPKHTLLAGMTNVFRVPDQTFVLKNPHTNNIRTQVYA